MAIFNNPLISIVSAQLFCHPKVNVFFHAGTRSVKMETVYEVSYEVMRRKTSNTMTARKKYEETE